MADKAITVKATEKKHSEKAKKDYLVVEADDGQKYTLWGNHELWDTIQPGFKLRLAGEQKGDFFNVSAFHLDLPDAKPRPTTPYPQPNERVFKTDPDKTASIQRQVALKAAVELVVAGKVDLPRTLTYADTFADWLEGLDVEVKDTATAVKPTAQKTTTPAQKSEMKNLGDLFKACKDAYNLTPTQVCKELGVSEKESIADIDDAWATIKAIKDN